VAWLTRWPELRDVVAVCIGSVVVLTGLGVWVATGRVLPWGFLGGGFTAIGVPVALAARRIVSTGPSSSSPPPLSSSPSSSPLPEAPDGQ
jgi:hypothetical protein